MEETIIDIQKDIHWLYQSGYLKELLKDRTTRKNILWATDAYTEMGEGFQKNETIEDYLIARDHVGVLKTRARKALEQQSARTRQHAEVFTPTWICKQMNDYIDADWFGRKGVFDSSEKITFPKGKTWKNYVDNRRLEITCGEAPYLVNRYDAESAKLVPIEKRIGILDRKFRIINENAADEAEWQKWAMRALQATFGYEFQGDNLLIARINVLMTYCENLQQRWRHLPDTKNIKTAVGIITWNLWQMDGLTDMIPYAGKHSAEQLSLLDEPKEFGENLFDEPTETPQYCRIYDWRNLNKSIEFRSIKEA